MPRRSPVPLANLRSGDSATIVRVNGAGAVHQRLLDMGMLPGETVRVERLAPAGDPFWIRLKGFELALRRNEAEAVFVSPA